MKFGPWAAVAAFSALTMAQSASGAEPQAPTSPAYVAAAAASDQFEIQSSQLALQKAQRADVKDFARMMVEHHTATSKDLAAAAKAAKLPPPPTVLPPDKARKLAQLKSAPAGGFDAAFMREQVAGHQEALALHSSYARGGDSAPLKQAAAKTAPIVQTHLQRAEAIAASAGR